jgi:hypothetical protein
MDHFGHRAAIKRNHGSAAGLRFDHHQAKRFRPVNREKQRLCAVRIRREADSAKRPCYPSRVLTQAHREFSERIDTAMLGATTLFL